MPLQPNAVAFSEGTARVDSIDVVYYYRPSAQIPFNEGISRSTKYAASSGKFA